MDLLIKEATSDQIRKDIPAFRVGDAIKVHLKVREGDKVRTQVFAGIVIARKGEGSQEMFKVYRYTTEGVTRIFPVNSPEIEKIEIEREGVFRRARLNYLKYRKGKAAMKVKTKAYVKPAKAGK